jgi:hypothetical protein
MLKESGKIAKSKSLSDFQNRTIGIAKENGIGGDSILVQISGRVVSDTYNFESIGKQIYARTNDDGLNITEMILDSTTATEDMIISLGKIDSSKSFILGINEFPFESGLLEQA